MDLKEHEIEAIDHFAPALAREDFELFWEYCFDDSPVPTPAKHHLYWHSLLKSPSPDGGGIYDRLVVKAARGWGKTSWIVRRILFEVGRNPNLIITIVCSYVDLAKHILDEIKKHIEYNQKLRLVFPNLEPGEPWARTEACVKRSIITKDPTFTAASVSSSGVGRRSNFIVFDDVVSPRTALFHPKLREDTKSQFFQTWVKFLIPGGSMVYLATPWHQLDLTMSLSENKMWHSEEFPALNELEESTWPEVYSTKFLMDSREEDLRAFESQMMLKPYNTQDFMFKTEHVEACLSSVTTDLPIYNKEWRYYAGVDLGSRQERRSTDSCLFVIGLDRAGRYHPAAIVRSKASAPEFMDMIVEYHRNYNFELVMVENNHYQQSMVDFLNMQKVSIPVEGQTTSSNKSSLENGVPAMIPTFAQGRWVIPIDTTHYLSDCTCEVCTWIQELLQYPHGRGLDAMMASWLAWKAVHRDAFSINFDDDDFIFTSNDIEDEELDEANPYEADDEYIAGIILNTI